LVFKKNTFFSPKICENNRKSPKPAEKGQKSPKVSKSRRKFAKIDDKVILILTPGIRTQLFSAGKKILRNYKIGDHVFHSFAYNGLA
jgi:hypothetical protein